MGLEELILKVVREEGREEGRIEGREEGRKEAALEQSKGYVINLLKGSDLSDEKIAYITSVSLSFVQEIKEKLAINNSFTKETEEK